MCHYRCIGFFVVYGKNKQMPARGEKFIHVNSAKEIGIKKTTARGSGKLH